MKEHILSSPILKNSYIDRVTALGNSSQRNKEMSDGAASSITGP
jgi:hypothetical protein